jgi:hypothetical protein
MRECFDEARRQAPAVVFIEGQVSLLFRGTSRRRDWTCIILARGRTGGLATTKTLRDKNLSPFENINGIERPVLGGSLIRREKSEDWLAKLRSPSRMIGAIDPIGYDVTDSFAKSDKFASYLSSERSKRQMWRNGAIGKCRARILWRNLTRTARWRAAGGIVRRPPHTFDPAPLPSLESPLDASDVISMWSSRQNRGLC